MYKITYNEIRGLKPSLSTIDEILDEIRAEFYYGPLPRKYLVSRAKHDFNTYEPQFMPFHEPYIIENNNIDRLNDLCDDYWVLDNSTGDLYFIEESDMVKVKLVLLS